MDVPHSKDLMPRTNSSVRARSGEASNASVTTSTSNLPRDEGAKIIRKKRSAASASLPTTPPREVIGNLSFATNDVTSPYDDGDESSDDGITPLATIVEEAAAAASTKHGEDDDEDEDNAADDDADDEDEDDAAADDADDHDEDDAANCYDDADDHDESGEEDDIIFSTKKIIPPHTNHADARLVFEFE
jgi:hypothetical protein